MNENDYRKKLTIAVVACVSVVILCVGMLSGGAYRQRTLQAELENAQAQLSVAENDKKNRENQASVLESQNKAIEAELSSIKAQTTVKPTEQKTSAVSPLTTGKITAAVSKPNKIPPKPVPGDRKVYLTFDDGPSVNTPKILKILKNKNAKATFFVINSPSYNHYMKDIVDQGHAIALHSYDHNYGKIYSSDQNFYNDVKKISDLVKKETGVESKLYRFPGGSSNTVSRRYSKGIMSRVTKGMEAKGYAYFDWNCSNGDAQGDGIPPARLVQNVKNDSGSKGGHIIVLMHDTGAKGTTVQALPDIIDYYHSRGFTFEVLTENTPPIHHRVGN